MGLVVAVFMLSGGDHSKRGEKHSRKEDVFDELEDTDTADSIIEDDWSEIG